MNYLPHYTKKRQILKRKEQELRRVIQRGGSEARLAAAAEEVRASRIRVLRAKRATILPKYGPEAAPIARIDDEIQALSVMPLDAILAEFGTAIPREGK